MNEVFEFLHGRRVTIDGVPGVLQHEVSVDRFGLTVERLMHNATSHGRRSTEYSRLRARLGDDYSTDLTASLERYCAIAETFGFKWKAAG